MAGVTQLVESLPSKQVVASSSLVSRSIDIEAQVRLKTVENCCNNSTFIHWVESTRFKVNPLTGRFERTVTIEYVQLQEALRAGE